jgi:hypothetical protein
MSNKPVYYYDQKEDGSQHVVDGGRRDAGDAHRHPGGNRIKLFFLRRRRRCRKRQPCSQNVRLGRKGFPGTNTLAYLASLSVKKMLIFEG